MPHDVGASPWREITVTAGAYGHRQARSFQRARLGSSACSASTRGTWCTSNDDSVHAFVMNLDGIWQERIGMADDNVEVIRGCSSHGWTSAGTSSR